MLSSLCVLSLPQASLAQKGAGPPFALLDKLLIDICPSIVFMGFSGCHTPRSW